MFKALAGGLKPLWRRNWLSFLAVTAGAFGLFLWRLGSLTPGLSPAELAAKQGSLSHNLIVNNPINAPFKILQYGIQKLEPGNLAALRLPAVVFALIFAFCFYKLSVNWFGRVIGLFGGLAFICLPLFVISARQASPEILFFAPVVLIWLYTWLQKTKNHEAEAWLLLSLAAAVFIYTPGMLIWAAAAFLLCRKRITTTIAAVPAWISAASLLIITSSVIPLGLACVKHPSLLKSLALVPTHLAPATQVLKNIAWMGLSLFVKTGSSNPLIVGRLPILNILLLALLVFGVYAMQVAARAKAILLALSVLFAVIAAGVNNNLSMLAFGLPAIGIFMAAGLRYLYIEWRSVFPRNPVPKTFALVLIAVVTATQLYFGLHYSLIAWPHAAPTRATYVLK